MTLSRLVFLSTKKTAKEAMRQIDTNGYGVVFVVDKRDQLLGVVTSGDIRRAIDHGFDINQPIQKCMNQSPLSMSEGEEKRKALFKLLKDIETKEKEIKENILTLQIPVVNKQSQVVDIVSYSQGNDSFSLKLDLSRNQDFHSGVQTVLIVGGAGYLGSVLTRMLLDEGYKVRVLDSLIFGDRAIKDLLDNPNFEMIEGDVRNIKTIHKCLDRVDAVIQLAAIVGDPASQKFPQDTIAVNYLATMALALACKYYQINRFIYASTCSVYGIGKARLDENSTLNPVSLYARTKIQSEIGILGLSDDNFKPVVLRMSTLFGLSPRMRFDLVVNTFAKMATTEQKITIFGGTQWRPLLNVEDAARAYLKVLQAPIKKLEHQVFNVGSNDQNYQISELSKFVKQVFPETKVLIKDNQIGQIVDKRTYKVSFDRIEKELNFKAKKSIVESLIEIQKAILSGKLGSVMNPDYYNTSP